MKKNFIKKNAFTLMEIMIVFLIIGIVSAVTIDINRSVVNFRSKYMYFSAFTNLTQAVAELTTEGCTSTDTAVCPTLNSKSLPIVGHNTSLTGFCDRLSTVFNVLDVDATTNATPDCSIALPAATGFDTRVPNIVTRNDTRYFNLSANPVGGVYTVYVDVNGEKGDHVLGIDVIPIMVNTAGNVYPFYSSANASLSIAATDTDYLTASVKYSVPVVDVNGVTTGFNDTWVEQGVNYLTAICSLNGTYYGTACESTTNYTNNCAPAKGHECEIEINKPSGF